MSHEKNEGCSGEVIDDGPAIYQPSGKIAEMLACRYVVKQCSSWKLVTVDDGDIPKEVVNKQEPYRNHACDNLTGSERGCKRANRNKE